MHDAYAMIVLGFANPWVSIAYIVAMVVIGFHLSHGVTSMFQSIGFRNESWRYRLNKIAVAYCIIIAVGFSLTPAAVLLSKYTCCKIMPVAQIEQQVQKAVDAGQKQIIVDYAAICKSCKECK